MARLVKKRGEIIPLEQRQTVGNRYKVITKAINQQFWDSESETNNSFYVGSYGRGTAINTSDIDILVSLPQDTYIRYNKYNYNGQSSLLQAVKKAILTRYVRSDVKGDGQIVKVDFSDGIKFEILPAFENNVSKAYTYPDSNMGGKWLSTNPKSEQYIMKEKNHISNGLFFDTCKHIRSIRNSYFANYHLPGIIIDSFVFYAIEHWHWTDNIYTTLHSQPGKFEYNLLNFFTNNYSLSVNPQYIIVPGSNKPILFDMESKNSFLKILKFMNQ